MAVSGRDFIRLKLRLTGNSLRGQGWRIALFVVGVFVGGWAAIGGFAMFAVASAVRSDSSLVVVGFGGTALTLAWLLLPLLFFGVDETIDPARFALLPIPPGDLLRGMVYAACVSIPAVATGVALAGLVLGGAIRGGVLTAVVACVGGVVALLLCVVGSRAVTSAFASMLRSRKVRDLAAVLIALLASSIAPVQFAVTALVTRGGLARGAGVARALGWTPLAAPYTAVLDAADGRWGVVVAKLGITAAAVAVLTGWWASTLESAMIGVSANGPGRRGRRRGPGRVAAGRVGAGRVGGGSTGSLVAGLFPAPRRLLPAGVFSALMAREWRYWWRDPRRRASMLSLTIAGVVLPVVLRVGLTSGDARTPLPLAVVFSAVLTAMALSNQFGNDSTAYALHLLIAVPGRVELRARAAALVVIVAPLLALATIGVGLATGGGDELVAALGTLAAGLGVSIGVSSVASVVAPYPFPDSPNPFATGGGTGSVRALLAAVGAIITTIVILPVALSAALTHGLGAGLVVAAAGLGWGVAGLLGGTYLAGGILDRRGPEVLVDVTARR
ncbi:MAG: type transport system permease protein [Micromonosporaceae bacterium]|nr:type transport system permease protein [Micromonosporaceae bacterium]